MAGGLAKVRQERKVLILVDSKVAIAAVQNAGRTGRAGSKHLREMVNTITEVKGGGGEVKLGWVKAHMGILGNEAADVVAKNAAEKVRPLDDQEKWGSGGGIRQWTKQRKREYLEEGEDAVIGRAMGWRRKAVTNYRRLRGGKGIGSWWEKKIGRTDDETCPKCGEEVKGERGRREWAEKEGMRWGLLNWPFRR